jgi:hypothetical protein
MGLRGCVYVYLPPPGRTPTSPNQPGCGRVGQAPRLGGREGHCCQKGRGRRHGEPSLWRYRAEDSQLHHTRISALIQCSVCPPAILPLMQVDFVIGEVDLRGDDARRLVKA